jgi:hypothetical protein
MCLALNTSSLLFVAVLGLLCRPQLFHSWLLRLVPPPLKRRLAKAWNIRYGGGASTPTAALDKVFRKQHDRSQRHQQQQQQHLRKQDRTTGNATSSSAAASGPVAEGTEQSGQLPVYRQQLASSSSSTSTSSGNGLLRRRDLGNTAAQQWPFLGPATELQQQQQQEQQEEQDAVSIVIPPVSGTAAAAPFATAASTRHRNVTRATGSGTFQQQQQQQPQQQQQLQGPAGSEISRVLPSVRSRDDLLAEQQQRVLHGEWRRAAKVLGSGLSLQVGGWVGCNGV